MCSVDTAIELAIENDAAADSGSDGHVDEPRFASACSPTRFSQSRRISVVLKRHRHVKLSRQIIDQALPAPLWKKIQISEAPGEGINWTGRPDTDACNGYACGPRSVS